MSSAKSTTLARPKDLTPDYCHVIKRIESYHSVTPESAESSIRRLLGWKSEIAGGQVGLPAPWVFVNADGKIEFEWETSIGDLVLSLMSDSSCHFVLSIGNAEPERGDVPDVDVTPILRRLIAQ